MAHAIKLNAPAVSPVRTKKIATDDIARKYIAVTEELKALEKRREELQEIVHEVMGKDSELKTSLGTFIVQDRRSYSWSLDSVKDVMGKNWTAFVKADDRVLRVRMETKDEAGCLLESTAEVKLTEALIFKKATA